MKKKSKKLVTKVLRKFRRKTLLQKAMNSFVALMQF